MTLRLWRVEIWRSPGSGKSPVEKEIDKTLKGNVKAQFMFTNLIEAVEKYGPTLAMPQNKSLGDRLFELRDTREGKRYYYSITDYLYDDPKTGATQIILLLGAVGGKDNKKEQQKDIMRARSRLAEITEENIGIFSKGGEK